MADISSRLITALEGRYKVERKLGVEVGLSPGMPHSMSPEQASTEGDLSARVGRS